MTSSLTGRLLATISAVAAVALAPAQRDGASGASSARCSLLPAPTIALLRVERDTVLPYAPASTARLSHSGVRRGPADSLLVMPGDPMPAARVRILRTDSTTRQNLAAGGVVDRQPTAFITAAPYRADCRTIRYTDSIPFAVAGEVGFVRASLLPAERWIAGVPVFVIQPVWSYPYPRRRAIAFAAEPDAPLASAEAMFDLAVTLEMPRLRDSVARRAAERERRTRALAWASENAAAAELEPARSLLRRAILDSDWQAARRMPSRLRGTYRVDLEVNGERGTWFFRTHDRPGYSWDHVDSLQPMADLVEQPTIAGYRLAGLAASAVDSLPSAYPRGPRGPLVWLGAADRPTTPGNDALPAMPGELMFHLAAAPEAFWDALEELVPPLSARDSALRAQIDLTIERPRLQPRIPLTLRLDARGGVHADTSVLVRSGALRVAVARVDTLSLVRPF